MAFEVNSKGRGLLFVQAGAGECDLVKVGAEESQEILRRARKRRRREMQAIVACMPPELGY